VSAHAVSDGHQIWKSPSLGVSNFCDNAGVPGPQVSGGYLYVGGQGDTLYALHLGTGKIAWQAVVGDTAQCSTPAVVGGEVYFDSGDTVYAFAAMTGDPVWTRQIPGSQIWSSPAVSNGVVYVSAGYYGVVALNAATGVVEWRSFGVDPSLEGSPAVDDGLVIVNVAAGLAALDEHTGEVEWTVGEADGGNDYQGLSSPVVADGVIYRGYDAGSGSGDFDAYDIRSGKLLFTDSLDGTAIDATAAVSNGVVFIGNGDQIEAFHRS
jgi:outer membrane protein assembly factor BamB